MQRKIKIQDDYQEVILKARSEAEFASAGSTEGATLSRATLLHTLRYTWQQCSTAVKPFFTWWPSSSLSSSSSSSSFLYSFLTRLLPDDWSDPWSTTSRPHHQRNKRHQQQKAKSVPKPKPKPRVKTVYYRERGSGITLDEWRAMASEYLLYLYQSLLHIWTKTSQSGDDQPSARTKTASDSNKLYSRDIRKMLVDYGPEEEVWESISFDCIHRVVLEYNYTFCFFDEITQHKLPEPDSIEAKMGTDFSHHQHIFLDNGISLGKFQHWGRDRSDDDQRSVATTAISGSVDVVNGGIHLDHQHQQQEVDSIRSSISGSTSRSSASEKVDDFYSHQVYSGGTSCPVRDGFHRKSIVTLECGYHSEITQVRELEVCVYEVYVSTPLACSKEIESLSMQKLEDLGVFGFATGKKDSHTADEGGNGGNKDTDDDGSSEDEDGGGRVGMASDSETIINEKKYNKPPTKKSKRNRN